MQTNCSCKRHKLVSNLSNLDAFLCKHRFALFTNEIMLGFVNKNELRLVSHLTIWIDGCVPFPFRKGSSRVLTYCSPCGTEATLYFSAGPNFQVFLLKPAPFCKLSAAHSSTNKSANFLLLSDSCSVLSTLSAPPSFLLPQNLAGTIFSLLLYHQATMGPRTLISSR